MSSTELCDRFGAKLQLGQVRGRQTKIIGLANHFVRIVDPVQEGLNNIANMNVVPFEMPFNNSAKWSIDIVNDNDTSTVIRQIMRMFMSPCPPYLQTY